MKYALVALGILALLAGIGYGVFENDIAQFFRQRCLRKELGQERYAEIMGDPNALFSESEKTIFESCTKF